jgi:unsaturated chondroitin disaccharide hydrolase
MLPDPVKGFYYWSCALHILSTLCEKHTAKNEPKWEGILKGGVYHVHKDLGVGESVMWGEYFFCEALENALRHTLGNEKKSGVDGAIKS